MIKYIVEKRESEITSYKAAEKVYEGVTFDVGFNHGDVSPTETYEFTDKQEALKFLNQHENYYSYNGSGSGWAIEWAMTSVDEDNDDGTRDYDFTPKSNFYYFRKSLETK